MTDVNEEIITEWLHLCKRQFTIDNIKFKVYGPKGGSNYSDVDILTVDKDGKYYDYEVKWRSKFSLGATNKETVSAFINQMLRKERVETIKKIIGNKSYQKVFITTYSLFGRSEEKRKKIEGEFNKNKIKIKYFEDIIPELVDKIETIGRYDSPILQTIRMLKYFKMVK